MADDAHLARSTARSDRAEEVLAMLALMATSGLGSIRIRALLERFGSAVAVLEAPRRAAQETAGRSFVVARSAWTEAARHVEACEGLAIDIVPQGDDRYPGLLRAIVDPPPVLFVRGTIPAGILAEWDRVRAVAVVGTRDPSARARSLATEIGRDLAAAGVVVVSGLALGVDGAAHRGALEARSGAPPLAVLAGGLDRVAPAVHRDLGERIVAAGGALIAEDPPGVVPRAHRFVARNRIVSGLVRAVAIIEAGGRSGALHTAEFATEQGREVFVVPDHPAAGRAQGNVRLLRSGAHLLTEANDILEDLRWTPIERSVRVPERGSEVLGALVERAPCSIDALPGDPLANLVLVAELEIAGFVVRDGLGRYRPTSDGRTAAARSTLEESRT